MLSPADLKVIATQEVIYDIARGLDVLAFENDDPIDRENRRTAVYRRIELAYKEYQWREMGLGWIRLGPLVEFHDNSIDD